MIAGMILNLCVLSGCSMDAQEDGKLRDLDFTVVSQEEQPDALRDLSGKEKLKVSCPDTPQGVAESESPVSAVNGIGKIGAQYL